MAANPIEVNYQLGRNVYCIRIALNATASASIYNTSSGLFEAYNSSNWTNYAIALTEVLPGYYRAVCPSASLTTPATEVFYERSGASPSTGDAPAIANGNSQGVNIGTVNGVQTDIGSNPSGIVDICNLALGHMGQKIIASLSDDVEAARVCNRIFTTIRDEVLRSASWKFATIIAALVNLPDEAVVGWSYCWTLPTDCVFIRKVYADDSNNFELPLFPNSVPFMLPTTNPEGVEYRVIYQKDISLSVIVTNITPSYIEYTGRVTDVTQYDPHFKKALSYKLAAELSVDLNGDNAQRDKMLQLFGLALSEAAKNNAIEDGVPQREKSTYIDVR